MKPARASFRAATQRGRSGKEPIVTASRLGACRSGGEDLVHYRRPSPKAPPPRGQNDQGDRSRRTASCGGSNENNIHRTLMTSDCRRPPLPMVTGNAIERAFQRALKSAFQGSPPAVAAPLSCQDLDAATFRTCRMTA
jgi:hypothetical protein